MANTQEMTLENPLVLVEDEISTRLSETEQVQAFAEAFVIGTVEAYEEAVESVQTWRGKKAEIIEWFKPMRDATNKAHKSVTGKQSEVITPLSSGIATMEEKAGAWREEQKRLAELDAGANRQRAAEEEVKRIEAEAMAAADAGDDVAFTRADRESIMQPVVPLTGQPEVILEQTAPKIAGMREKLIWTSALEGPNANTSLRQLCRAIADGDAAVSFVAPVWKVLNKYAGACEGDVSVPGIVFHSKVDLTIPKARSK